MSLLDEHRPANRNKNLTPIFAKQIFRSNPSSK